ncbi:aromatic ring-hydroxylating dioxygenase subunit alpha [Gilvimarinus sp. F26214L]|uniref:aromatic ring-hydroxylating dioxygenase subunit alpha n=1 Tax=Gilvimarinus sp. DZF01 TaxID=3461371 RepID=UPI004045211D
MEHHNPWPENCWYVAAMSRDLAHEPLGRIICNHHMVFYRNGDERAVALEDFCPHRGLPLSKGTLHNGALKCGYHGMVLNDDGSCRSMVGQNVSRLRGVNSYPVVERYGFIWVWPGDAEQADPALLPPLDWAESDKWAYGGDYYHMACDYRLLIDNLMDLTHETYVHTTSIGQPEIEEHAPEVSRNDGEIRVSRIMQDIVPPPFWGDALAANNLPRDSFCDRWQVCRFVPPSQVLIDVGVALAGHGGQDAAPDKRARGIVVDMITPETETTCHYFWGMARNFSVDDPLLTETMRVSQGKIFAEDMEVLQEQQNSLSRNPERRLAALNIDAGGIYARRVIERMIAQENGNG